jgi:hypothetical protein
MEALSYRWIGYCGLHKAPDCLVALQGRERDRWVAFGGPERISDILVVARFQMAHLNVYEGTI